MGAARGAWKRSAHNYRIIRYFPLSFFSQFFQEEENYANPSCLCCFLQDPLPGLGLVTHSFILIRITGNSVRLQIRITGNSVRLQKTLAQEICQLHAGVSGVLRPLRISLSLCWVFWQSQGSVGLLSSPSNPPQSCCHSQFLEHREQFVSSGC